MSEALKGDRDENGQNGVFHRGLKMAMGWESNVGTPDNSGVVVKRPGSEGIRPIRSIDENGIVYQDSQPSTNGHSSPLDGEVLPD